MNVIYTFGDSILDCERYNPHRVHPGQLLVKNNDQLFPEWAGRDLLAFGPAHLEQRARDGATVDGLAWQVRNLEVTTPSVALLTVGGNDLLMGLVADDGSGLRRFASKLEAFLSQLPIRPVLISTIYDPTFGDDSRNFLPVAPAVARANHQRVHEVLAELAERYGRLVDIHGHFLAGDPSWYTSLIEPSLRGASEVRSCFWPHVLAAFGLSQAAAG